MIWTLLPSGILEVARPRAVAMRARLRRDRHAVALEKRRPAIDIVGVAHDQPEMIERAAAAGDRPARRRDAAPDCRCPTMR